MDARVCLQYRLYQQNDDAEKILIQVVSGLTPNEWEKFRSRAIAAGLTKTSPSTPTQAVQQLLTLIKHGKKIYAVAVGRIPGLYDSWAECEAQTKGYPRAAFKSFIHESDAWAWVLPQIPSLTISSKSSTPALKIYTDGSVMNTQAGAGVWITGDAQSELVGQRLSMGLGAATISEAEAAAIQLGLSHTVSWKGPIEFFIDSDYARNLASGVWTNKSGRPELAARWDKILALAKERDVRWRSVDAHTGDPDNDQADRLAKRGTGLNKGQIEYS